jgi:hypothetical protein
MKPHPPKSGEGDPTPVADLDESAPPLPFPTDDAAGEPAVGGLPNRYLIKEDDEGRYLTCVEAPEIKIRLQRDLSVPAAAARKYPEGTIFLDGAALAPPFLDLERQVYNLDHHEGCVRRFTLASCEQALVLVLRGLDLRTRAWTVWANSPDLDTVLAVWLLLNALHLSENNADIKRTVIPLVRLEGLIDSQGLELVEFSGFSEPQLARMTRLLEQLREAELEHLRRPPTGGEMRGPDLFELTASLLHKIDELVYPTGFFEEMPMMEELAREELGGERIVVVCHSESGIYEIETVLKRLYGKRLGVIILQKDDSNYTLRQVDSFLPVNLEAAYRRLNLIDPAAGRGGHSNRWGGSGEIGGSPRRTGTDLTPTEIARACKLAYQRPPIRDRIGSTLLALVWSAVAMAAGWLAQGLAVGSPPWTWEGQRPGGSLNFAAVGAYSALAILAVLSSQRRRRLFGVQVPVGNSWLLAAPGVFVGAVLGGVWVAPVGPDGPFGLFHVLALLHLPLFAELTFRGIAHGLLVRFFSVVGTQGRWFLSWPAAISALIYTFWTAPLGHPSPTTGVPFWPAAPGWPLAPVLLSVVGALVAGVSLAICRERSGSLLAPLTLHYSGVAVALLVAKFIG